MPKKLDLPTTRCHIILFKEDLEFLEAHYGRYSPTGLGLSEAMRLMVHKWVKTLRERANEAASARQGARGEEA